MSKEYLAAAIVVCTSFSATAEEAAPAIRAFEIDDVERLGREIYDQDQLAWVASDVATAQGRDPVADQIRGWIVVTEPEGYTVRFIRPQGETFVVAYDVVFRENALPALFGPATPELNAEERAQYDARSLALENIELRCTQSYNTVALPDPDGEGWLVWALAATTEPNVMQIGGHHRFTVSADGQTVEQRDTLSRSCLAMSTAPEGMPEGASLAFLTVSHIVSTTPVETHVFLNLQHDISLMVITGETAIWEIEDGEISPADLN